MKSEIYLNRLKAMSLHYAQMEITEHLNGIHSECQCSTKFSEILSFEWAIWQFCYLFPRHWKIDLDDRPYLVTHPEMNCLLASSIFLNINLSQVFSIFTPHSFYSFGNFSIGSQPENARYGSVAHQIHWLIVGLEQELKYSNEKYKSVL